MPPRENSLGVPGQAASNAQNLQNVRQQGANYRGQQIYNDPTTHAGREAQAAWLKNNPIPHQSIDTVYGGVNYGNKLQKDTEVAVDQEQIGRGGPGTASAMMRAGLLDANGYKPNTPGVNLRDTRSEAAQYAEQDRVMADIKREGAEARARGEQFQPKGVNTVNPSRRVDISGDRRRLELKNGEPKFSRDEGGVNYAGPKKQPAPLAAPTPPPVAQATPAPTGYQWKSKETEKLYNDTVNKYPQSGYGQKDPHIAKMREEGVIRPDGSYNPNAQMSSQQQGPNSPQQSAAIDALNAKNKVGSSKGLPGGQQSTAELQASGQMAPRPAGRYGMTDEQWFNTPEGQKQAQAMKDTHAGLLKDGKIGPSSGTAEMGEFPGYGNVGDNDSGLDKNGFDSPELPKPDPRIQAGIAPPMGSTQSGGFSAPLKSKEQLATEERAKQEQIKQKTNEMLYGDLEKQIQKHQSDLKNAPGIQRPTPPPSSGIKGSSTGKIAPNRPKPSTPVSREIDFQERTPNAAEMMEDRRSRAYTGNSGADKIRDNVPEFGESFGAQQVRPKSENEKLPTIKKSSPITDTIKASNTPIPEANTPKPTQQPIAQRKPLFPRLGGRLRK